MDKKQAEEGWAALSFQTDAQHDLASLATVERILRMNVVDAEDAINFGQRLLTHVHPATYVYMEELKLKLGDSDKGGFCTMAQYAFANMRHHFKFEELTDNQRRTFYAKDGPLLLHKAGAKKLLVVFATMYNTFFFSNAAICSMLSRLDCSILLLRDSTLAQHLLGVKDFAFGVDQIGPAITTLAAKEGFDEFYIAAYSSSTYAALRVALTSECRGFLGFSTATDRSRQWGMNTPEARERSELLNSYLDQSLTIDLKPLLSDADPSVKRTIYYGERAHEDVIQAEHVADLDTIETICLRGIGHTTPLKLMADRALLPAFAKLIDG